MNSAHRPFFLWTPFRVLVVPLQTWCCNTLNGSSVSKPAIRVAFQLRPDHATNMIEHAKTAQFMSNLPPTESKALTNLIRPNTSTSLFRGGTTDWAKTLKDFDALSDAGQKAQFGNP
jgi:hypothetical protein